VIFGWAICKAYTGWWYQASGGNMRRRGGRYRVRFERAVRRREGPRRQTGKSRKKQAAHSHQHSARLLLDTHSPHLAPPRMRRRLHLRHAPPSIQLARRRLLHRRARCHRGTPQPRMLRRQRVQRRIGGRVMEAVAMVRRVVPATKTQPTRRVAPRLGAQPVAHIRSMGQADAVATRRTRRRAE